MNNNIDVKVWANCYYNSLEDDNSLTIERDTSAFDALQNELFKNYWWQTEEHSIDYI